MKLIKWILIFILAFIASFILIITFSQPVFKETASARIVGYVTPDIPVYYYIVGAFAFGLLIGMGVAVYNFITGSAESIKKSRRIRELEREVEEGKNQIPQEPTPLENQPLPDDRVDDNNPEGSSFES